MSKAIQQGLAEASLDGDQEGTFVAYVICSVSGILAEEQALGKTLLRSGSLSLEHLGTFRPSCWALEKLAHLGAGCREEGGWKEAK